MRAPLLEEDAQSAELNAAAAAALECTKDSTLFVNECEPVLGRFNRAVIHYKQTHAGQSKALDALQDKDLLVHFMIDCVRNRFTFQRKVTALKAELEDSSNPWKRAFRDHLRRCPTCRNVDLSKGAKPSAPPPKRPKLPIPFIVEVLALCGLLLPLLAYYQGCDCITRILLIALGLLLWLPLVVFEFLWCTMRDSMKWHLFVAGPYAVDAPVEGACWRRFWTPTGALLRVPVHGDSSQPRKCLSWGHWGCPHYWPVGGTVEKAGTGERALKVTCDASRWSDKSARLGSQGAVHGLNMDATCTGNTITFKPDRAGVEPKVWVKLGCRRLDVVRKTLMTIAAVGLLCILTATAVNPQAFANCCGSGPQELRAMFMVDSSGSVSDNEWKQEKEATVEMIHDFDERFPGRFHAGLLQFSSKAYLEVPMTDNISVVVNKTKKLKQKNEGTTFSHPLKECQRQLDNYKGAGNNTFDLCVLMSDGLSGEKIKNLKLILKNTTRLMTIFVGNIASFEQFLKELSSCNGTDCPFFASAKDFDELKLKIDGIAEELGGMIKVVACDFPRWVLSGVLLLLPLLLWWVYLHCCFRRSVTGSVGPHMQKAPEDRLRTAGVNQSHK